VGLLVLALTGLVAGVVGALVPVATGRPAPGFPEAAAGNPVTAVLLDVRGYDTLLETAVLLLALAGVAAAGRGTQGVATEGDTRSMPLLLGLVRLLVPAGVLIAGALVWLGAKGAGGAFQAGAVLGGSGILLQLTGLRALPPQRSYPWVRLLAVAGTGVFLGVALGTLAAGRGFLDYPAAGGASLVLLIEVAAAVAVGVLLLGLFEGVGPFRRLGGQR
jgi:multisubunit Na+/H+ antiporter MnhB subunit